ncbi:MAG: hypothetical protein M3Y66_09185 [Actinomycetota bacterium]|nr:hypothetical protein [Actinomycetota bacterium]
MTENYPPPPGARPTPPGRPPGIPSPAWPPTATLGRPLHKPGTVPLRPLTLSDFFDGAFATIRRNPKSTIGVGALVTTAFMLAPIFGALLLAGTGQLTGALDPSSTAAGPTFGDVSVVVATLVSGLFSLLANIVVAGLIVPVVTRATIGEYISPSAAWRQARGRLLRLVALALVEMLAFALLVAVPVVAVLLGAAVGSPFVAIALGIVLGILAVLAGVAMHARFFQLVAPTLVVEKRGIFASIARAGRLSRGNFWRILGTLLLVAIATYVVSQIITVPFSVLGLLLAALAPGTGGMTGLLLSSNVATIVSGAVVAPFTGAVAVLQYLDQRFRKEGFDIELINHVQSRRPSS